AFDFIFTTIFIGKIVSRDLPGLRDLKSQFSRATAVVVELERAVEVTWLEVVSDLRRCLFPGCRFRKWFGEDIQFGLAQRLRVDLAAPGDETHISSQSRRHHLSKVQIQLKTMVEVQIFAPGFNSPLLSLYEGNKTFDKEYRHL